MCGTRRVPKAPEMPTREDPAVQEAIKRERELARRRRGRRSTILTGPGGVGKDEKKTLLG